MTSQYLYSKELLYSIPNIFIVKNNFIAFVALQLIGVEYPSFADVIKVVGEPLLFEHSVPLLAEIEWFATPTNKPRVDDS